MLITNKKGMEEEVSDKKLLLCVILCACGFFGFAGIHRFYTGKVWTGLLMLLTMGLGGIWTFIDFIFLLFGNFRDKEEKRVAVW